MAVSVAMHNTGGPTLQMEVRAMVEHVLADRPGDWRISIIGTQASDQWDLKIHGPNAFERSYTLEGTAGQHERRIIASIVFEDGSAISHRQKGRRQELCPRGGPFVRVR